MPDNYEAHIDLSRLEVSCNHQINIPDKYHIQKVQMAVKEYLKNIKLYRKNLSGMDMSIIYTILQMNLNYI